MNKDPLVLVTGATGFVGAHMVRLVTSLGYQVIGVSREPPVTRVANACEYVQCNLVDAGAVLRLLEDVNPAYVIHLAGAGSVSRSWESPAECMSSNVVSTINLLDGLRVYGKGLRGALVTSSSHDASDESDSVTRERSTPSTPYGWSKRMQGDVCRMYADCYELPIVIARTYNLAGPGNSEGVCSQLAKSVVNIEQDTVSRELKVGNTAVERDFLDVRDATRAYWMLLHHALDHKGETFNVCSGRSISIGQIVSILGELTEHRFQIQIQGNFQHSHEPLRICGNPEHLMAVTGWKPEWPLEVTLADTVNYFRNHEVT